MPPAHEAVHLLAAVTLVGSGILLAAAAWRRSPVLRPAARPCFSLQDARRAAAAACTVVIVTTSLGAAAIHLAAVGEHLQESILVAAAFATLAVFQLLAAAAWVIRPAPAVAAALVAIDLGAALVWLWSRTAGLPFLPDQPEMIGRPDAIASLLELATIGGVVLARSLRLRTVRIDSRVGSIAAVAPVPVAGVVLILTLLAFTPGAVAAAHDHNADDHPAEHR